MSYEGREITICINGHLEWRPCSYSFLEVDLCHCGAQIAWHRAIDDTNCEAVGDFPIEFFKVKTPAVEETCPTCNHTKLIKDATYEIPICTNCGSKEVRSNRSQPEYGGTPFVGDIRCGECGTVLFGKQS